jgi:DNA primase
VVTFTEAADHVKATLDILSVVGRSVSLKKRGRNYLGLCPFHNEKTPSFNVNPEKNLYKCFGCGEAGDPLAFIMKTDGKSYSEVIREQAAQLGLVIQHDGKTAEAAEADKAKEDLLYRLNTEAAEYFARHVEQIADLLARRGLTSEASARYGLGFAPPGWENLTRHLLQTLPELQRNPELLVTAGLASPRQEGGGCYDRFRNRLIIPIHDTQGRVVAFGGRALSDEDAPKYLNSPETPLYVKSRLLYGFHRAKDAIRTQRYAVIMEGYFDVLSAQEAGVLQAVGTCGTALTSAHLKLLTRTGADTIYLAFDADAAGRKAALSAIELITTEGQDTKLKVLQVPSGKDPDGFIREHGGPAFLDLLGQAVSMLDFQCESALLDLPKTLDMDEKVAASNRLAQILSTVRHPVARDEAIRRYAPRLDLAEETLSLLVSQKGRAISQPLSRSFNRRPLRSPDSLADLRRPLQPRHLLAENQLMTLLFAHPDTFAPLAERLTEITFSQPVLAQVHGLLLADGPRELKAFCARVTEALASQPEWPLVSGLMFGAESTDPLREPADILAQAQRCIVVLNAHHRTQKLAALAEEVKRLERDNDADSAILQHQYALREHLSNSL